MVGSGGVRSLIPRKDLPHPTAVPIARAHQRQATDVGGQCHLTHRRPIRASRLPHKRNGRGGEPGPSAFERNGNLLQ
jgi:hypothetical protein